MRPRLRFPQPSDYRYVAEMESFLRAAGFDHVFNDERRDEELADAKAALKDAGLG